MDAVKLDLLRVILGAKTTIGVLSIDGKEECFICEDTYRPPGEAKVPKRTAIPEGTYEIVINRSPRFGRDLPRLLNVPGFEGILIHPGNDADDTEGCLLPGRTASFSFVGESVLSFNELFAKLKSASDLGGKITITVHSSKGSP